MTLKVSEVQPSDDQPVDPDLLAARLQAVEAADSAQGLLDAVEDLAALGASGAIDTLIRVLGYNNPGAAVAAVEGLVQIGMPASQALLQQIDGYNYGARAWALRVLSGVGDPAALDLIVETALSDFSLSVRRAAARGLGAIRWEEMPAADRQSAQQRARDTLLKVTEDEEWVVRYAAVVGLAGIVASVQTEQQQTDRDAFEQPVLNCLQAVERSDEVDAVKARAAWAIAQLSDV